MPISRRSFLRTGGIGFAAATLPLPSFAQCGEPPRSAQPGGAILLSGNENPYGPLPSAKAAMAHALEAANRYPDPKYDMLIEAIMKLHRVKREQVHATCGSTEVLKMAADEFVMDTRGRLVVASPTFEAIGSYTEADRGAVVRVPLRPDFSHDLPGMLKAMGAGPGLFYICNPNNPTASLTPRAEIEDFLKRIPPNTYVLIDEAYHHFAVGAPGYESFLDKPVEDERVFVARTFSKVYGMAGLRVGYVFGAPETVKRFRNEELYDSVNCVGAYCAAVPLGATAELQAAVERNARDRAAFVAQCDRRRLPYIPSHANFAMLYCGSLAREVRASMAAQGIRIGRPFPPMDKWCRISFGTPDEMAIFWKAWDGLRDCLGEIRET